MGNDHNFNQGRFCHSFSKKVHFPHKLQAKLSMSEAATNANPCQEKGLRATTAPQGLQPNWDQKELGVLLN